MGSEEDLENEKSCFGEFNKHEECANCFLREKCKRFTNAERQVSIRYKGKYKGRGKERRKDKY